MAQRGRIYFIDYDKVFKIFKAPEWLRDGNKTHQTFEKAGFKVKVWRDKGLFWDTIHIAGWKFK